MKTGTTGWLLWVLIGLSLVAPSCMQETAWEKNMAAGEKAYEQGHYAEAEKH